MIARSLDEALAAVTDGSHAGGAARELRRADGGDAGADPARRQAAASGDAADLDLAGGSADRRRLRRDAGDLRRQPRRIRSGAALHRGDPGGAHPHAATRPVRRCTRNSRRRRRACRSCRCAGSSAPTCWCTGRIGRCRQSVRRRTIRSCCCRRSSPMWRLFHAPLADRYGNVFIGTQRELSRWRMRREDHRHRGETARRRSAATIRAGGRRAAGLLYRRGRGRAARRLAAAAARPVRHGRRAHAPNMHGLPRRAKDLPIICALRVA